MACISWNIFFWKCWIWLCN
ncbi:hypothetical protein F383_06934 [Gossypium arboreum]|uniref:Uncharacterized protein n=1 Tax=Gossypium arboreum TaxID=29729 RepID=A0A0B0NUH8_GOSAR|nr:hypothetical protein F383_06934 [Gossypium arboreum]